MNERKGKCLHRLQSNPMEEVFSEAWHRLQKDQRTLEFILADTPNHPCDEVSERDEEVAATVIQWLGSPCGQWFLEALPLIEHGGKWVVAAQFATLHQEKDMGLRAAREAEASRNRWRRAAILSWSFVAGMLAVLVWRVL